MSSVSASYSRGVLWRSSEAFVVRLQARCRGFLVRRRLEGRRRYLISQTPAVVIIQVSAAGADAVWLLTGHMIIIHLCASVSLEEVRPAEGLQAAAAVLLQELEVCRQGNQCCVPVLL